MNLFSFTFVLYLAVVAVLYYSAAKSSRKKKIILVVSGTLFYSMFSVANLAILLTITIIFYLLAAGLSATDKSSGRKTIMAAGIAFGAGTMLFFKYISWALDFAGYYFNFDTTGQPVLENIRMPIGMSFYMFSAMSSIIDAYRAGPGKKISLLDYSAYLTFFPYLLSGPIMRFGDMKIQFDDENKPDNNKIAGGIFLILLGLFEKMIISDQLLSHVTDKVYALKETPSFISVWVAVFSYAGQIYYDFNGYTMIAMGGASLLGIRLNPNFNCPYASSGIGDFWRRWHMTLSFWFRDYFYIPMGGSKKGKIRHYLNLILTMLICGIWHGSSLKYLCWGFVHGLFLAVERIGKDILKVKKIPLADNAVLRLAYSVFTCAVVSIAWIFFRAGSLKKSFYMISNLVPSSNQAAFTLEPSDLAKVALVVCGTAIVQIIFRNRNFLETISGVSAPVKALLVMLLILSISTMSGNLNAFIYFQF